MLVSTTSEIIQKLQEYEAKYGVGAIISIGTYMSGDRKNNYRFEIENAPLSIEYDENESERYHREYIEISAIDEDKVFSEKY